MLEITIKSDDASCNVCETETGEPYTLFSVAEATGPFVGELRQEAEEIFAKIAENCCLQQVFKNKQTNHLLSHAEAIYGTKAEYLWKKFPENAVLRRQDNQKWYAAVLTAQRRKFFSKSDGIAELVDLREEPAAIASLIDNRTYFPAYHMNKQHWYTVLLEGAISDEELFERLRISYEIAERR